MESSHQEFAPNQGWDHQRVLTFHTARHGARLRNRRQAYHVGLLAVRQTPPPIRVGSAEHEIAQPNGPPCSNLRRLPPGS